MKAEDIVEGLNRFLEERRTELKIKAKGFLYCKERLISILPLRHLRSIGILYGMSKVLRKQEL